MTPYIGFSIDLPIRNCRRIGGRIERNRPMKGLRKLPFRKIAEQNFAAPARVSDLARDVIDIAHRRDRDPKEFAAELIADARRAA